MVKIEIQFQILRLYNHKITLIKVNGTIVQEVSKNSRVYLVSSIHLTEKNEVYIYILAKNEGLPEFIIIIGFFKDTIVIKKIMHRQWLISSLFILFFLRRRIMCLDNDWMAIQSKARFITKLYFRRVFKKKYIDIYISERWMTPRVHY